MIGALRRSLGVSSVRALGGWHGLASRFGTKDRTVHELDRLKQQAEVAIGRWAAWWTAADGELKGEYCACVHAAQAADEDRDRRRHDLDWARQQYESQRDNSSERAMRDKERVLDQAERWILQTRQNLERARTAREGAFGTVRQAAYQQKDYAQALMRAYSSANRSAVMIEHLPDINIPPFFEETELDWICGGEERPVPTTSREGGP